MFESVWFVDSKSASNCGPLLKVFEKIGAVVKMVKKENLYDMIEAPQQSSTIPIMMFLKPDLPLELIQKLTQWRSNLIWPGPGLTPVFAFVVGPGPIEEAQKQWDPGDLNDYDFMEIDQLLKEKIAKRKFDAAKKLRKNAESGVLIGESESMRRVKNFIEKVKESASNVLILGESGTGKEIVARIIHMHGARADNPFIVCNTATLPRGLVESSLFGHKKGAFTGAISDQDGAFEQAHTGTLFLDEIGELEPAAQAKLLRVLEDRKVQKIGEEKAKQVDVRVVAATNRDLDEMVREKKFREDLFFRLDVVSISVPPLRERMDDLPALLWHFCRESAGESGKVKTFDSKATEALFAYNWPGNVRELKNAVERGYVLSNGIKISYEVLPERIQKYSEKNGAKDLQKKSEQSPDQKVTKDQNEIDVAIAKKINPDNTWRLDPDHSPEDRAKLKMAIEFCNGCIDPAAKMLKMVGYKSHSSSGFIKNRLGLNKSNMKNVIPELHQWYFKKYRT